MNIPALSTVPLVCALGLFLIPAASGSALAADPPGWQLVWADEFDAPTVDSGKWVIADKPGDTNNELQYYAPDEAYIDSGALVLRSRQRSYGGRQYTSGLVHTRERFAQMYGRVEVRARLPGTQGLWPAHWMLPESGAWPPEIDIMELKGREPRTVYMTHHWGTWPNVRSNGTTFTGPDFTAGYHTFAVEWSPGRIRWFVDDVLRFESVNQNVPAEPMYLILNTAVGGDFGGNPDGTTVFPQFHRIDYVRVYTRDDPGDGQQRSVDYTFGGVATDGTIEPGEYVAGAHGINDGFGDRIGAASMLGLDSDRDGWFFLGIDGASPWPPGTPDGVVVYLDTRPGGVTSTISMIDNTTSARALASGRARLGGEQVDLFFADGFAADFALVMEDEAVSLFALAPTFQQFVSGAELDADTDVFGGDAISYRSSGEDPTMREIRLRAADIAAAFGSEVRAFATQLNGDIGDRSNEYIGVAPGQWFDDVPVSRQDVQLPGGSFLTFVMSKEFCPGDANEDRVVDTRDVLQFLVWWAAKDPRADLVHDGTINTLDLLAFLALWNEPCL